MLAGGQQPEPDLALDRDTADAALVLVAGGAIQDARRAAIDLRTQRRRPQRQLDVERWIAHAAVEGHAGGDPGTHGEDEADQLAAAAEAGPGQRLRGERAAKRQEVVFTEPDVVVLARAHREEQRPRVGEVLIAGWPLH